MDVTECLDIAFHKNKYGIDVLCILPKLPPCNLLLLKGGNR